MKIKKLSKCFYLTGGILLLVFSRQTSMETPQKSELSLKQVFQKAKSLIEIPKAHADLQSSYTGSYTASYRSSYRSSYQSGYTGSYTGSYGCGGDGGGSGNDSGDGCGDGPCSC